MASQPRPRGPRELIPKEEWLEGAAQGTSLAGTQASLLNPGKQPNRAKI